MTPSPGLWRRIRRAHRSQDETLRGEIREFFLPRPTAGFFLRMLTLALIAFAVFYWLLIPCVIDGASMTPTYPEHGFTFCWRLRYWLSPPRRGDVVVVRHHDRVFYLKRVVALAGDTVEFRAGRLFVNGEPAVEPYVRRPCDWNLPPRTVDAGYCYVIGDNRDQPIDQHNFGSVSLRRIVGAPFTSFPREKK